VQVGVEVALPEQGHEGLGPRHGLEGAPAAAVGHHPILVAVLEQDRRRAAHELFTRRIAVQLQRTGPPGTGEVTAGDWDAALRRLLDQR
jgi:hypothetical protein